MATEEVKVSYNNRGWYWGKTCAVPDFYRHSIKSCSYNKHFWGCILQLNSSQDSLSVKKKIINARQDKLFCLQGTDFVLMSFPWIIFFISSVIQWTTFFTVMFSVFLFSRGEFVFCQYLTRQHHWLHFKQEFCDLRFLAPVIQQSQFLSQRH